MKGLIGVVTLACMLGSGAAMADGHEVLEQCQSALKTPDTSNAGDLYNGGFCQGMITSIVSLQEMLNEGLPPDAQLCTAKYHPRNGDMVRAVVGYLSSNPTNQSQDAAVAVFLALHNAYPCK